MKDLWRPGFSRIYCQSPAVEKIRMEQELEVMRPWGIYNSSAAEYEALFSRITLPDGEKLSITDIAAKEKILSGGRLVGLDLCGQGDCLTALGVTRGMSVCLRHNYYLCSESTPQLTKLDGNLLRNGTINQIDRWIAGQGPSQITLCVPVAGSGTLWGWADELTCGETAVPYLARTTTILLMQRMLDWTAPGGHIFLELQNDLTDWLTSSRAIHRLKQVAEIHVHPGGSLFHLIKK